MKNKHAYYNFYFFLTKLAKISAPSNITCAKPGRVASSFKSIWDCHVIVANVAHASSISMTRLAC